MGFFSSESDANLNKQFQLSDCDVFISKIIYEGAGVESESSNDITLTPVVSPVWIADAYNTTNHYNLVVQADASKCFIGPTKDTLVTGLLFDCTAMKSLADGTAGAATDWAVGATYNFYVMDKGNDTYVHGDYFGHVKDITVGMEEEYVEFMKGIPREKIVEDLLGITYTVKGKNFQISNQEGGKRL